MHFCSNCGKENPLGSRFCGNCGTEQNTSQATCSECGKALEGNEKFCSSCGASVNSVSQPSNQKETEPPKEKYTKESRKIIGGGPKQNQPKNSTPPLITQSQKKKRGCLGCFITTMIILTILVVGVILAINFATDWFDKIKEEWNETTQVENTTTQPAPKKEEQKAESKTAGQVLSTDSRDIKSAAENLENIFEQANINALQVMLTETSVEEYKTVLKEIQPYMPEYAKAFKNRKLVYSTPVFAQYSFHDEEGNEYTAEFALTGDGQWKLVRF